MTAAAREFVACPFRVVIDDREKRPFAFAGLHADARQGGLPLRVETAVRHLPTGDYSIEGMEHQVACERKSLCDLYSTLGQHRDRFERELARLAALDFAAVVVEAEWSEVLNRPPPRSSLNPKAVIRSVMAWQVRYRGVQWWFVPGRAVAEAVTLRLLQKVWQEREKAGKVTPTGAVA